jgi:hypothetical protein
VRLSAETSDYTLWYFVFALPVELIVSCQEESCGNFGNVERLQQYLNSLLDSYKVCDAGELDSVQSSRCLVGVSADRPHIVSSIS